MRDGMARIRETYVGVPTGCLCGFEGVRCNPKVGAKLVHYFWYHQEGDMAHYRIGKCCRG